MATNLMNVFKTVDLQGVGKTAANIVSLAFKPNKKLIKKPLQRCWIFRNPPFQMFCARNNTLV